MGQKGFSALYMGGVFLNNNFSYAILPLKLIYDEKYNGLSADEKLLYTLLLNRTNSSRKNRKRFYDENGLFIFFTIKQIQQNLNCSNKSAIEMMKNLEKAELIKKEYQKNGLPAKIYVTDLRKTTQKSNKEDVSFDINLAEEMAHKHRDSFGTKKNNRRHRT